MYELNVQVIEGLSQLSIKTRIETHRAVETCMSGGYGLSQLSIKTRIETWHA